jgi:hypothetical protein
MKKDDEEEDVAMQVRCVGCFREHYAVGVFATSLGGIRCGCGHVSKRMTRAEYGEALRRRPE